MSRETIRVTVGGMQFAIQQFKATECIEIEFKIMSSLSPALEMLENFKGFGKEFDLGGLGKALQKVFLSIRNEDPIQFILSIIKNTIYMDAGQPKALNNSAIFDEVFLGKTMAAYTLCFEVMKANKMAFLEVLGGSGLNLTDMLDSTK